MTYLLEFARVYKFRCVLHQTVASTVICAVPMGNSSVPKQSRIMTHRFAKISSLIYAARTAVRNMLVRMCEYYFPFDSSRNLFSLPLFVRLFLYHTELNSMWERHFTHKYLTPLRKFLRENFQCLCHCTSTYPINNI